MTEALTALERWSARLLARLSEPVDAAWLVMMRVLFGSVMLVSMLRFPLYGWVDEFYVERNFHFKYWGFHWVEPLSGPAMHALLWVLAACALCVIFGLFFRPAALVLLLGYSYVQLIDVTTYINHYYLASLLTLLLALSPAAESFSLDALRRRGRAPSATVPRFWLYLLRFQVGVVYTFAGLAKAQSDWLLHAQPLGIWLGAHTGMPLLGPLFSQPWAAPVMSWAGFLFDTTVVWFLLFARTRPFAYVAVILFHAVTRALFPIGMFPFIMVLSALVFFPPDWPRALVARARALLGRASVSAEPPPAALVSPRRIPLWLVALAGVYCAVHLVVPMRFLLHDGNVLWHEQGMRFSWRVMVREKNGSITYLVRQREGGKLWHVSPRKYLDRVQEREMSGQPDLVLQLAHHVARDFEARGLGPVEVRVDARVSLNGRRAAPLIDPEVDLTRVSDGLGPAPWITPAPASDPPRLRPLPQRGVALERVSVLGSP
ncbi:MAG: HTTM domain-containing protein [Polyangiaceae bacterium]|nr:HTTM domain-containing protein [Polyangiaceae bacterium]